MERSTRRPKLIRKPDWEQAAARYFTRVTDQPHAWGRHDCVLFCASAVEAMTGVNLVEGIDADYQDEAGSFRVLASLGAKNLADMVDQLLEPAPMNELRRGDVLQYGDRNGFLLINWSPRALGVSERGVVHIPFTAAARAWRVG